MALPSQTSRAETWRSSGSSGNTPIAPVVTLIRRNKAAFAGGLAIAAVAGVWYFGFRPKNAVADYDTPKTGNTFLPPSSTSPQTAAANQPGTPSGPTTPSAKPTTISMRSLNDPAAHGASKPAAGTSLDDLIAQSGSKSEPTPSPTVPSTSTPVAGGQPGSAIPPADPLNAPGAAPTATPPTSPSTNNTPAASSGDTKALVDQANTLIQQSQPLEARKLLNDAMMNAAVSAEGRAALRAQIATLNETLFFSPTVIKNDTITDEHTVASGETLGRIVRKEGLPIDWRLLVRINKMPTENSLRVGQKLKIVRQPLHAVVHKATYRMDIYAGPPITSSGAAGPDGQEPGWTYIRSFPVGLGESNGTPEGSFIVKANSKLVNPKWVNPRTGEVFQPDDPKNPIGERWIGLEGVDENTRKFTGYGVHGTIDPDSIGQQKSMGCVRLAPADIEMVYEMLVDRVSTVKIVQ